VLASIVPPCSSTSDFTRGSPRPEVGRSSEQPHDAAGGRLARSSSGSPCWPPPERMIAKISPRGPSPGTGRTGRRPLAGPAAAELGGPHGSVGQLQLPVRRDDVHVVRAAPRPLMVAPLGHRHARLPREDHGQLALPVRRQMHNDDVGGTEVTREVLEEPLQRLQPSGRGANPDNGDSCRSSRHFLSRPIHHASSSGWLSSCRYDTERSSCGHQAEPSSQGRSAGPTDDQISKSDAVRRRAPRVSRAHEANSAQDRTDTHSRPALADALREDPPSMACVVRRLEAWSPSACVISRICSSDAGGERRPSVGHEGVLGSGFCSCWACSSSPWRPAPRK
jgi:hypothetical protein